MIRRSALLLVAVLSVALLVLGNLFALRTAEIFAEESAGFVAFVNAIGVLALTSVGVGVAIAWRVRGNPIPWLLISGALMLQGVFVSWPLLVVASASAALPELALGVIAWWGNVSLVPALVMLLPMVVLLFPGGSLPGPRWRLPLALVLAALGTGMVLATIAPWPVTTNQLATNPFALPGIPTVAFEIGGALAAVAAFAAFGLALGGMVVRFRRSRGVERAQLKWLLAAVALMSIVFPVSFATDIGPSDAIDLVSVLVGALIPLAIGIAILRVTSTSTAWRPMTRPMKTTTRTPDTSAHDAERTAAAFAERLRNQVDLIGLEADIASTVASAIRPSRIGVWMRTRTDGR